MMHQATARPDQVMRMNLWHVLAGQQVSNELRRSLGPETFPKACSACTVNRGLHLISKIVCRWSVSCLQFSMSIGYY